MKRTTFLYISKLELSPRGMNNNLCPANQKYSKKTQDQTIFDEVIIFA